MTRMLPATTHSSVKSNAERKLFERIRDAPGTEDWICVHSLGLAHRADSFVCKRTLEANLLEAAPGLNVDRPREIANFLEPSDPCAVTRRVPAASADLDVQPEFDPAADRSQRLGRLVDGACWCLLASLGSPIEP